MLEHNADNPVALIGVQIEVLWNNVIKLSAHSSKLCSISKECQDCRAYLKTQLKFMLMQNMTVGDDILQFLRMQFVKAILYDINQQEVLNKSYLI